VNLNELIVQRRVGNGRQVENRVELFAAELPAPIQGGQVLGNKVAPVTAQIFEITGPEIINHGEPGGWNLVLEGKGQVGADKAGPAGDEQIGSG